MKTLLAVFVVMGASLWMASEASAQVYYSYYAPAPVVTYRPVVAYQPAVTTYYAPTTVYRPAVAPAYVAPAYTAPYVVGRPAVAYYSGYGGYEVRVAGQPVRNFFRAVIP